jgi:hypothetical protein
MDPTHSGGRVALTEASRMQRVLAQRPASLLTVLAIWMVLSVVRGPMMSISAARSTTTSA